jgi:esterase/lipase
MVLWIVLGFVGLIAAIALLGPREPVVTDVHFDETQLDDGVDAWLARQEARFDDIVADTEKRVIWVDAPESKADWAIVYVHGFSASSEEVRPLPDDVARALGANLIYTRLTGHGRPGHAMAEGSVQAWMEDLAEALAIARRIGDRVMLMGTSTGATLATLALHEDMGQGVDGVVFISPNYQVQDPAAVLLTFPAARWWAPLVAGRERGFTASSADHDLYWSTSYPTVALLPMAASVQAAKSAPHEQAKAPALFIFDPADDVVNHDQTRAVASRWGGHAQIHTVDVTGRGDDNHHVIAGDVMSPMMTDELVQVILNWVKTL